MSRTDVAKLAAAARWGK